MSLATLKRVKTKKCAQCRCEFQPQRMGQRVCSPECAQSIAKKKREKIERLETKIALDKLKTRSQHIKDTQRAFNSFIRERDKAELCICCDKHLDLSGIGGGFDCGHYRSVGSAPHLRFDENNAHGQSKQCNRWGAGRAVDYRIGLIRRIGLEAVEALEADQEDRKYTIPELQAMKAHYTAKTKELRNERD